MTGTVIGISGVTFPDGTVQSTAQIGGVTSFVGQTGAVDPTVFGAIGSVVAAMVNTTSNLLPNSTIAGSNLLYPTTITVWGLNGNLYTEGSTASYPYTYYTVMGTQASYGNTTAVRATGGNTGYTGVGGHAALAGTWRLLTAVRARTSQYYSGCCLNTTSSFTNSALLVRIA
jgi:hypothetical protein